MRDAAQRARDPRAAASLRTTVATDALLLTAALSRRLRIGSGSTIGGRAGLAIDPGLLAHLGATRTVALVSATNGKTTTTRLLANAVRLLGDVATSQAGANMDAGLVTALAHSRHAPYAVLEVDEAHLPRAIRSLSPSVVALLNLSRDQLDRTNEVRMLAARWREALAETSARVVANADDPLVVWAASAASSVSFVGAGSIWHEDAYHCPSCEQRIEFSQQGWACSCGFVRPTPDFELVGDELVEPSGRRRVIELALPGRFNLANAAIAAVAASDLGLDLDTALAALSGIAEVGGRFAEHGLGGGGRLMLAKNPAGWSELIALVAAGERPVVISINARIADGRDPSWLWDVPFEQLARRRVLATGERRMDLALRLRHAGIDVAVADDARSALSSFHDEAVDFIGNYTAFQDLRLALRRERAAASSPLAYHRPVVRVVAPGEPSTRRETAAAERFCVVVVHPDLLGTYGDGGNARVLANRMLWRDIPVELVLAPSDEPLPRSGDLYCLGGGEDGPQARSCEQLRVSDFAGIVSAGATVFAVCAGYQILGDSFPTADGTILSGLGLLPVATTRGARRAVGEIVIEVDGRLASGFENHAGVTERRDGLAPFGELRHGLGNGDGSDGARLARLVGTYLHGPALARNAFLADALLELANGSSLSPLDDELESALLAARLSAVQRDLRTRAHVRPRKGRHS